MPADIIIALCSYNGGRWLKAQLDSIAAQDHQAWALWVSDDGSTDDTRAIVKAFQARHPSREIHLIDGPRQGGTQNFMSLICHPDLPLTAKTCLALCDQDDIWLPQKISQGLAVLAAQPDWAQPLIYGAQSRHIDQDGREIGHSRRPRGAVLLQNAVVQNMVSGHSLILNPAALALARQAGRPLGIGFQDWWLSFLVLACGGRAVIDDAEVLLYRQHSNNVMGAPKGVAAAWLRLWQLTLGTYQGWIFANLAGLTAVENRLTPAAKAMRDDLTLCGGGLQRLQKFRRLGIHRQSKLGSVLLYAAVFLGLA
jgi:glycosyltransferase involved in cell wall biosynthesis